MGMSFGIFFQMGKKTVFTAAGIDCMEPVWCYVFFKIIISKGKSFPQGTNHSTFILYANVPCLGGIILEVERNCNCYKTNPTRFV
jgi:hypothetical protein